MDSLNLKKFDMKSIMMDSTILILGRRRTGKSWLIRDLFYNNRDIPIGAVFSSTEAVSPFFRDFIPDIFIHEEYDSSLIEMFMRKQMNRIHKAIESGVGDDGKTRANNVFLVMDDLMHSADTWKKDKTIKNIFFNGRHYNLLFILTLQYPMGITPELRSNIDYVFIFDQPSVKNKRKIYDDYAGIFPSFDYFCNVLESCTQDHKCLVIKTGGGSGSDISNNVFWYKAEKHDKFQVGHSKIWEYHGKKFNKAYGKHSDVREDEIDSIKKHYGSSKKLKVLVSKQGDIIECKEH
jgi:hypothetical protein